MKYITAILLALVALAIQPAHAQLALKQATAAQAVLIGPFVDTDGAAVTGLTIDAADVRISINGANIAAKTSGGCTHDELGMYVCTFDATDTATVGRMQVMVAETGALIVYHDFQVVEEAVYDACCAAASAPLTATAVWAAGTRTLTALDEDTTTLDLDATTIGTATTVGTVNALAANSLTAAAAAADLGTELGTAVWATTTRLLTAGTNIGFPSADDISNDVWTEALADHSGTAGSTAEALNAAGAAGDPWITALPGAYSSGQAGFILGTNLNATVSSRSSQTSVDDVPTNAELTTALGTLNDLDAAAVEAAADAALATYDGPTNAEMEARTLPAGSYYDFTTDSVKVASYTNADGDECTFVITEAEAHIDVLCTEAP